MSFDLLVFSAGCGMIDKIMVDKLDEFIVESVSRLLIEQFTCSL
jgi:hypothetical protein